jgi:chromosome partitioning protein
MASVLKEQVGPSGPSVAPERVTEESILALDEHLTDMMERLKGAIFQPLGAKPSPVFNAAQLAALCKRSPNAMLKQLEKAGKLGLADGLEKDAAGKKVGAHRSFTLEQAIDWVRHLGGPGYKRKPGQKAAVITVGFFKGGVGKTTLATSAVQGLSLKGYKVLAIDFDPQGSMTAMLGVEPGTVPLEETFTPVAMPPDKKGARPTLIESIRPTYWSGVDLIAGSIGLGECELYLPMRAMNAQSERKNFNFLDVLNNALKPLKDDYDFIVIDTPPQLSYTTMNAYLAADGILMPVVPEGLSLQSSVQFWNMFCQLIEIYSSNAQKYGEKPKEYAWLGVVPSKVEAHKPNTQEMLKWIRLFYGQYVMASELPLTEAVKTGGTEWATIYDISKYVGSAKTYERAREAFDRVIDEVEQMTRRNHWHEQI